MMRYTDVATLAAYCLFGAVVNGHPWEQSADDTAKKSSHDPIICNNEDVGEWFREGDHCRDAIQCTAFGIQVIRCPAGQFFDIERQSCDPESTVKNCKVKKKENRIKPFCREGFFQCRDSSRCIERGLLCNGERDCFDGSDESSCASIDDSASNSNCDPKECLLPDCLCSEGGQQ